MVVIGWWGLSLPPRTCFQGRISLFVYVHARNNCLHISVRAAIGIFECEAHFKQDNSTSQCVCVCRGYEVMEGFTCFTVRRGFCWWGGWMVTLRGACGESVGSVQSQCRPEPGVKLGLDGGGRGVGGVIWWSEDSRSRLWPFAWPGPARPALWIPAESHWRGSALTPPWQQVATV